MSDNLNQGIWVENKDNAAVAGAAGSWQQPADNRSTAAWTGRKDTEETGKFKENYGFFAPAAFLYAALYIFCMYKNGSGITFPFFVGGGLLFLCLSLSKLGLTLKEGSIYYIAAMILLGISTFCTDDYRIIIYNKLGVTLLMLSLMLKQFYDTSKWKLGKYVGSIFCMVLCLEDMDRPVVDGKLYRRTHPCRDKKKLWAVILGLLIAVPLTVIVIMLLSDADAVFRQMTNGLFADINMGNIAGNVLNVLCRMACIFFASYMLLSWLCRRTLKEEVKDRRTGEPITAITVTGLLTLLYLLFSGIQIGGLFLGRLQLPEGYTYAMYAREGFFQLLAVGFINLIIVLVCISFFRESSVLKAVLTVMSLCTFIMIASSAVRMIIYIHYYYMTFLRILVLWGLALLALLFLGIVINIFREDFPLFRYSVAVVTVLYLALSFARPDYIIARVNIAGISNETADTDRKPFSDYAYLSRLSADAAPVLVPWMQEQGYRMEAYREKNAVIYADDNIDKYIKRANSDREETQGYKRSEADGFGYYWMRDVGTELRTLSVRTFNVSRYMALKELKTAARGQ